MNKGNYDNNTMQAAMVDQDEGYGGTEVSHYNFIQKAGDLFFLPRKYTHGTIDLTPRTLGFILKGGITATGPEHLQFASQRTWTCLWPRRLVGG